MQRAVVPIVLAVIFLALMVFYLIPGINHPLASAPATGIHVKHAVVLGGLALLSVVWARLATSSPKR